MASLLIKDLASMSIRFPSSRQRNLTILTPHFSTKTQQKEDVPFIAQYLISSFGISEDRALRASTHKNLAPIKTPDRPESVIRFLIDTGLTDSQVKEVISLAPHLLATSVSNTLEPCAREVISGGFTKKTLLHLIRYNPLALCYKNLVSRLQFWRDILGNDEEALLRLLKNRVLINSNIHKKIIPQINFLREYGWSEEEMQTIFKKYPTILGFPEENVKYKMNFLIEKAGLDPKCIVDHPYLLAYNLEKRMAPRHYVLSVLKSKGLIESYSPYVLSALNHKGFVKGFIEPYVKEVPELAKAYADACAGKNATIIP